MFNYLKEKKGVSLIVLIITIGVLLILLSTVTISYSKISSNTKKRQFAKEIYEVQKLVDKYKYENDKYPYIILDKENNEYEEIEVNVTDENRSQFETENISEDNKVKLYPVNLIIAGVENLSRGVKKDSNENDVYAFSKETGIVYYVKGYKVSKDVYYTLTDELASSIGIKAPQKNIEEVISYIFEQGTFTMAEGILFDTNTRLRTTEMLNVEAGNYTIKYTPSDFMWNIFVYDTNEKYIQSETPTVWHLSSENTFEIKGDRKVKFLLRKLDNSIILSSEVQDFSFNKYL